MYLEGRAWEITWRMTLRTTSGLCLGGHQAAVVTCAGAEGASMSWIWGWGHTESSSRDLPGVGGTEEKKDI